MKKSKFRSKLISVAVVISLLLTCFAMPTTAVTSTNDDLTFGNVTSPIIDTSVDNNLVIDAQPIVQNPVLKSAIPIVSDDCKILHYIDEDYFQSDKHILRLKTLEDLNTYVFQNYDGTRTVYIMDENVKFVDENGSIKEKDLTLINQTHGFSTTQSDIDLLIPMSLSAGISMDYSGYSIKLTPQGAVDALATVQSDNSVLYSGAFGANTSVRYTPTLSGIKEDIILSAYTDINSYTFVLDTDGLHVLNNGTKYYLATSQNSDPIFYLGDIIIYDAIGKPDIGTMSVTPIEEGQKYLLTLTVNNEFLADPTTVYPVTIDPTIEVSANSESASIEDAPIFENYPDMNFGTYVYNRVGTPSATYGIGRTVVRLKGLIEDVTFNSLNSEQIESVYFYVTEASGGTDHTIYIHPLYESDWTESGVTWNNYGGHGATACASAVLTNNREATFDITSLVKDWIEGYHSADAGFIMLNSNESLNKSFYSAEYSTGNKRPKVVLTYKSHGSGGGDDFESAVPLSLNNPVSVSVVAPNEQRYFSFSPSTTGFYSFESSANDGDPKAWLYNKDQVELVSLDDAVGVNFKLIYHLTSGCTYYLGAGCYSTYAGAYTITLRQASELNYETYNYVPYMTSTVDYAYAVENNSAYEVEYFKFVPSVTGNYLFYSFDATYDPKVWIYDSDLISQGYNDDGAKNLNFRYTDTLIAGETYYIVAAHFGSRTGSYCMRTLVEATIPTDVYYLKNTETEFYLEIHGPSAQEYVHQWSFRTNAYDKWTFNKGSDGCYTIQSEYGDQCYVGVSSTSVNTDNVKLYSSISDKTKWKIYAYSTGELLLEPQYAKGTLLYVPNSTEGTELQLAYMSTNDDKAEWKFEINSDTPIEGQRWSMWCWATAARMVSRHYYPSVTRTQNQAVSKVKGSVENLGGWEDEVQEAMEYYIGNISGASLDLQYVISDGDSGCRRYSEYNLRRFLNDGHTIEITRSWYRGTSRTGGHCYAVVGYTTVFVNGSLQYRYMIYNPWPNPEPYPWNSPVVTTGQAYTRSYQWICNGKNAVSGEPTDTGIWEGFVTVVTSYSNQTLMPIWNS